MGDKEKHDEVGEEQSDEEFWAEQREITRKFLRLWKKEFVDYANKAILPLITRWSIGT